MEKRILVTGAGGQLGRALVERLSSQWRIAARSRSDLDITDRAQVSRAVDAFRPYWVLNCAAFTAVDLAEDEPDAAFAINDAAVGVIADAAQEAGARVLHYSTDYVFDGEASDPYIETDATEPRSVYGRSKLAGEDRLMRHGVDAAILRTSWLYSHNEGNFFSTMVRLGNRSLREGKSLRIVDDQIGTPTDTTSLADQTARILDLDLRGLFHASCEGSTTWCGFAREIFDVLSMDVRVEAIPSSEYPQKAPRPRYSVLDNHALKRLGENVMPRWRDGLGRVADVHRRSRDSDRS